MKKAIRLVAEENGLSRRQMYKVQDWEIWRMIKKNGYDKYISKGQVKKIRRSLPKGYFDKYF